MRKIRQIYLTIFAITFVFVRCSSNDKELLRLDDERFENVKRELITIKSSESELTGILFLPRGVSEDSLNSITVWNPIYPEDQSTCFNYALRDVSFMGYWNQLCNLTYDYSGIGRSSGHRDINSVADDQSAIRKFLQERFPQSKKIQYLGYPALGLADKIKHFHLRADWDIGARIYKSRNRSGHSKVIYFSDIPQWTARDDTLARAIADSGHTVYGLDLIRLLMDGSMNELISITTLRDNFSALSKKINGKSGIVLLGHKIGACVALAAAPKTQYIMGVVAINIATNYQFQNPYLKNMLNMMDKRDYELSSLVTQMGSRRLYLINANNTWNGIGRLLDASNTHFTRQEVLNSGPGNKKQNLAKLATATLRGISFVEFAD